MHIKKDASNSSASNDKQIGVDFGSTLLGPALIVVVNRSIPACIDSQFLSLSLPLFVLHRLYSRLWSNGAKEFLEYADYSFEQHFGRLIPSYPPRAVIFDYLTGRAKAGDIRKFIRFRTAVRHVDFDDAAQQFKVTIEDLLVHGPLQHLTFDHVIVATGHYTVANVPDIQGLSKIPGRVVHSHDYRGADEFVGQNLLVIGGGYSAEDIAMQCYKFGAGRITISYRSFGMGYQWPSSIREVPLTERIEGHTAYFKDGSKIENIDSIILCTGYRHQHRYMAEHLQLRPPGNYFIPPNLYKGIFWVDQPRLAYLGMQNQTFTFTMFDAQAVLVRDVFLGNVELPAKDEASRSADIAEWQAREAKLASNDHHGTGDLQTEYMRDILSLCDQTTAPQIDLDRASAAIHKFFDDKERDITTYRDQPFHSIYPPYKKAPVSKRPWLQVMDDSIDSFLASIVDENETVSSNKQ